MVELLGTTGLRPKASSTSAVQSNRMGSCCIVLNVGRTVGDGAGSRTLLWLTSVLSCSPASAPRRSASHSLVRSCFSLPFASTSLPTPDSSLSCCSSIDIASFESVAVAVVVALSSNWVGMNVDVVMTWCAFSTRSSHSGVVAVL